MAGDSVCGTSKSMSFAEHDAQLLKLLVIDDGDGSKSSRSSNILPLCCRYSSMLSSRCVPIPRSVCGSVLDVMPNGCLIWSSMVYRGRVRLYDQKMI